MGSVVVAVSVTRAVGTAGSACRSRPGAIVSTLATLARRATAHGSRRSACWPPNPRLLASAPGRRSHDGAVAGAHSSVVLGKRTHGRRRAPSCGSHGRSHRPNHGDEPTRRQPRFRQRAAGYMRTWFARTGHPLVLSAMPGERLLRLPAQRACLRPAPPGVPSGCPEWQQGVAPRSAIRKHPPGYLAADDRQTVR